MEAHRAGERPKDMGDRGNLGTKPNRPRRQQETATLQQHIFAETRMNSVRESDINGMRFLREVIENNERASLIWSRTAL